MVGLFTGPGHPKKPKAEDTLAQLPTFLCRGCDWISPSSKKAPRNTNNTQPNETNTKTHKMKALEKIGNTTQNKKHTQTHAN